MRSPRIFSGTSFPVEHFLGFVGRRITILIIIAGPEIISVVVVVVEVILIVARGSSNLAVTARIGTSPLVVGVLVAVADFIIILVAIIPSPSSILSHVQFSTWVHLLKSCGHEWDQWWRLSRVAFVASCTRRRPRKAVSCSCHPGSGRDDESRLCRCPSHDKLQSYPAARRRRSQTKRRSKEQESPHNTFLLGATGIGFRDGRQLRRSPSSIDRHQHSLHGHC